MALLSEIHPIERLLSEKELMSALFRDLREGRRSELLFDAPLELSGLDLEGLLFFGADGMRSPSVFSGSTWGVWHHWIGHKEEILVVTYEKPRTYNVDAGAKGSEPSTQTAIGEAIDQFCLDQAQVIEKHSENAKRFANFKRPA